MAKRPVPQLSVVHHRVGPPQYSPEEISGLKDQSLRLEKHIEILEEEIKIKKAELVGIKSIIEN
jgi:hypothetical protein